MYSYIAIIMHICIYAAIHMIYTYNSSIYRYNVILAVAGDTPNVLVLKMMLETDPSIA